MLTAGEAEVARVDESNWEIIAKEAWVPSEPSDRKVWLCLHCLDGPDEESWMTLKGVESHLQLSCVTFFRCSVFIDLSSSISSMTKVMVL